MDKYIGAFNIMSSGRNQKEIRSQRDNHRITRSVYPDGYESWSPKA